MVTLNINFVDFLVEIKLEMMRYRRVFQLRVAFVCFGTD